MTRVQKFTYISGEIDSLYHEAAFRLGQSDSSMTVLYTLLETDGKCRISEISRLSGIRKQTLNSALRKMEKNGIVRLENSTGKNKFVVLTERGEQIAAKSAGRLRQMEETVLQEWTEDEIDVILKLSERFLSRFRELVYALPAGESV